MYRAFNVLAHTFQNQKTFADEDCRGVGEWPIILPEGYD